jgi:hypothetical protein
MERGWLIFKFLDCEKKFKIKKIKNYKFLHLKLSSKFKERNKKILCLEESKSNRCTNKMQLKFAV